MYKLVFKKPFKKSFKNIEKSHKEISIKIINFCYKLKNNPYSFPYKKLNNNKFRYRLGKFRIFIEIDKNKLQIYYLNVKKRKSNTYK